MPSNRGQANHLAVSPISDSNAFMAGFSATSESNDLMTGSCRSYTAALLATSNPGSVWWGAVPAGRIHVLAHPLPRPHPVFVGVEAGQIDEPQRPTGAAIPDLSPSDPAAGTPGRG